MGLTNMEKTAAEITDEEKQEVENLAALFFTPSEIGIMLELNADDVRGAMYDEQSAFYRAFYTGRLQSEADLRKSIMKLAKSGSSPAQTMSLDLLNKSKAKMLDR